MSYLWYLDGLSMALGWAIYGTWNWWTWWLHEILTHEMSLYIFFNTRFFWTRITRITRIFFCTRNFLRGAHTDLTHGFWAFGSLWMTARCGCWLVMWLLTCCGYWLIVVIDSLWLLTRYGCWLVVVIGLLYFKWQIKKDIREPCEALAEWDPCAK